MDWFARLIGRRVVYLIDYDGEVTKRWAKVTPHGLTCRRMLMLKHAGCLLLPDGTVRGPAYVTAWKPQESKP